MRTIIRITKSELRVLFFSPIAFIIISLKFTSLIFAEEFEITPIFCCDDESILIFSKFIPTSEVVISFRQ